MRKYFDFGAHKKLNELVFAGSHDAGVTSGKGNSRTQSLDILKQAQAGVRIFDIRIAAKQGVKLPSGKSTSTLSSYHAPGVLTGVFAPKSTKTAFMPEVGITTKVKETNIRFDAAGAFGIDLQKILEQASSFVKSNAGNEEFIILKFDKCSNWTLIAEACFNIAGDVLYKGGGNLNEKTLGDVKGKVIIVFTTEGITALNNNAPYLPNGLQAKDWELYKHGIVGIKNLNKEGGGYSNNFVGLQYFGAGGTNPIKLGGLKENEKKQTKIMAKGGANTDPNVMGMMYWTITGLVGNIENRNAKMWSAPNKDRLKKLWYQGGLKKTLEGSIQRGDINLVSTAQLAKKFIPNFIMVDFADDEKCRTIYELNTMSAYDLASL